MKPYFLNSSKFLKPSFRILALPALILVTGQATAADILWSGTEGDFAVPTNWAGGVVPGTTDAAILSNGGKIQFLMPPSLTIAGVNIGHGEFVQNSSGITQNGPSLTVSGPILVGVGEGTDGLFTQLGDTINSAGGLRVGSAGGKGKYSIINGQTISTPPNPITIGSEGGEGEVNLASGFLLSIAELLIGTGSGSIGSYVSAGNSATVPNSSVIVGIDGATGHLISGGTASFSRTINTGALILGRGNGSTATVMQNGGLVVNNNSPTYLGESGDATATWTLGATESSTVSTAVFDILEIGHQDSASGTVNLNAGELSANRIVGGASSGAKILNLNGGAIKSRARESGELEMDFISNLTSINVNENGAIFDIEANADIGINHTLTDGGGGLIKRGVGALTLSGASNYSGPTVIEAGSLIIDGTLPNSTVSVVSPGILGGTGTLPNSVTSTGTIAPGSGLGMFGTLTVEDDVDLSGGLLDVDATAEEIDLLVVEGDLNITNANLSVFYNGDRSTDPQIIATYGGTLNGTSFASITGLEANQRIDYAYEGNKIAIVPVEESPYSTWAAGITWANPADSAADADPDNDGIENAIEFMIGGNPLVATPPAALPTGTIVGSNYQFVFRRAEVAKTTEPVIEFGTTLSSWTVAVDGAASVNIDSVADGTDEIWTVTIPLPTEGKLFARLKVVVP